MKNHFHCIRILLLALSMTCFNFKVSVVVSVIVFENEINESANNTSNRIQYEVDTKLLISICKAELSIFKIFWKTLNNFSFLKALFSIKSRFLIHASKSDLHS